MAFIDIPLIPRPRVDRLTEIALSIMHALTTIAGAIIEWNCDIPGTCPTDDANRPEMPVPEARSRHASGDVWPPSSAEAAR